MESPRTVVRNALMCKKHGMQIWYYESGNKRKLTRWQRTEVEFGTTMTDGFGMQINRGDGCMKTVTATDGNLVRGD